MKIAMFGGSFNPIHNGHIQIVQAVKERFGLDKMLIMVAGDPPHKEIADGVSAQVRYDVAKAALEGMDGIEVCDLEIRRGGKSYTYDTVKELMRPDTRLFLLLGTDMVLTFDKWYRSEDLFKMCYPVYVRREKDPLITNRIVSKITEYYEKYGVMIRRVVTEPFVVSSTEIRAAIKDGKDISHLVPKKVADFILERGLYK